MTDFARTTGGAEAREGTPHLVLTSAIAAPRERVWESLVNPVRLEQWIGTYTGDPASGSIEFFMTAEAADAPAETCTVHECTAPERLVIEIPSATPGETWKVAIDLVEEGESTTVRFAQPIADPELAASVGPGWEYYLDRWAAVAEGRDPAGAVWEHYYPVQAEHYRSAVASLDLGA